MAKKNLHYSYLQKEVQLGMKMGTAQHRLRMSIMFHLAKKCGMGKCYRCGLEISSVGDFSIDHKEPWVRLETEKYWDVENIAFAHKSCNYRERRDAIRPRNHPVNIKMRKAGPEGTSWCNVCVSFLPVANFTSDKARWNGLQDCCRSCRRTRRSSGKYKVLTSAAGADSGLQNHKIEFESLPTRHFGE